MTTERQSRSPEHAERPWGCWEFILREVLTASVTGAFGRARVYRTGASDQDGERLRTCLRRCLHSLEPLYVVESVTDRGHVDRIEKLADEVSVECSDVLLDGRLRIGVAQKAVNLFLKYLWCLGRIPEPPHCPFDGVVISRLPPPMRVAWTRLDCVDTYLALVEAARALADSDGQTLARWELEVWNAASRSAREPGANG